MIVQIILNCILDHIEKKRSSWITWLLKLHLFPALADPTVVANFPILLMPDNIFIEKSREN